MKKSSEAFRTISEVSGMLDIPAHVLRFWESKFSQIKPVKRGGGRRYYRPDDINLLRGIQGLLYTDGLTIKGAQKLIREKGIRHVIELGADEQDGVEVVAKALEKHQTAGAQKKAEEAAQPGLFEPAPEATEPVPPEPVPEVQPEPVPELQLGPEVRVEPASHGNERRDELERIIDRLRALRDSMRS
jgi:DNA-binding transcriptional MerR regulator